MNGYGNYKYGEIEVQHVCMILPEIVEKYGFDPKCVWEAIFVLVFWLTKVMVLFSFMEGNINQLLVNTLFQTTKCC